MIDSESVARSYLEDRFDDTAILRLERFAVLLTAENEQQNLVARNSLTELWQRHFADSAQLLEYVPRETTGPWLDLGSGAGFPGLVIALLRPEIQVVVVESRRKRIEWLQRCVDEFALNNCRIDGTRLEQVNTFKVGVISARAFAPLAKLLSLSARFSTPETLWLLPKGRKAAQELVELPKRESRLFHVEQSLTDAEAGIIVGHYNP